MKFNFTDKSSYLAWRQKWKADYQELSQTIRMQKRSRKQFINRYSRTMTANGPARTLISREANPLYDTVPYLDLVGLSTQATFMLEQLVEAKALSWSMKQAMAAAAVAA